MATARRCDLAHARRARRPNRPAPQQTRDIEYRILSNKASASRSPAIPLALSLLLIAGAAAGCGDDPEGAAPLRGAVAITVGSAHACALLGDGTSRCWGSDVHGQLGDGRQALSSPAPVAVKGLAGATALTAGALHTCALAGGGEVRCWGNNAFGQIAAGGPPTILAVATPTPIAGLADAAAIAADARFDSGGYTCAVRREGSVACWGNDPLPRGPRGPVTVEGLSDVVAVAPSTWSACALGREGGVSCWIVGQIHGDARAAYSRPTVVAGVEGAVAIAGGAFDTCALVGGGRVKCWNGVRTKPGDPPTAEVAPVVDIPGLENVKAISAAGTHTCALLADGTVRCWQTFVPGHAGSDHLPTRVEGLSGVSAIDAGESFDCALLTDGTVKCWGKNDQGQLGIGRTSDGRVTRPVTVIAGPGDGVTGPRGL